MAALLVLLMLESEKVSVWKAVSSNGMPGFWKIDQLTHILFGEDKYVNLKVPEIFFFTVFTVRQLNACTRVYPEVSGLSRNKINSNDDNKHSLGSNTKGYGGKTHETGSQNSDTTAPNGRELYHLQFSLQAASPETFGYTFVPPCFQRFLQFVYCYPPYLGHLSS
jgi:hypothetical protein